MPVQAGIFNRKPKADTQKARQLVDTLRTDPLESRRVAAATELAEHDPKANMDVLSALIGALQRDESADVRLRAARALAGITPYSAQAGLALERTADGDRSQAVRDAAREVLWQYHLNGYQSQFLAERTTYQTAEPPLAPPKVPIRMMSASAPPVELTPPEPKVETPARTLPPSPVPTLLLPPLVSPPGVMIPSETDASQRLLRRPGFPLNRTDEPPFAKRRSSALAAP